MKFLQAVGGAVIVILLVVAFVVVLPVALKWGADVNREVIQHSQGYIQSKTQLLNGLITDYNSPTATQGQQQAIVNEFCYQVTLLLPEEQPNNIVQFKTAHC